MWARQTSRIKSATMKKNRARVGFASAQLPSPSSHFLIALRISKRNSCQREGSANSGRSRTARVAARIFSGGGIGSTCAAAGINSAGRGRRGHQTLRFGLKGTAEHFEIEAFLADAHVVVEKNGRDNSERSEKARQQIVKGGT